VGLFLGRLKGKCEMSHPDQEEDRLSEYFRETYRNEREPALSLLRQYLPALEREDPDWQVAVLKDGLGVIVTEEPHLVKRILVLGLGGEKILFRKASQAESREK